MQHPARHVVGSHEIQRFGPAASFAEFRDVGRKDSFDTFAPNFVIVNSQDSKHRRIWLSQSPHEVAIVDARDSSPRAKPCKRHCPFARNSIAFLSSALAPSASAQSAMICA